MNVRTYPINRSNILEKFQLNYSFFNWKYFFLLGKIGFISTLKTRRLVRQNDLIAFSSTLQL